MCICRQPACLPLYRCDTGQIREDFSAYRRFQETFSERIALSFEKLAFAQFEAAITKILEQKQDEMTRMKTVHRQPTGSSSRTLPQYSATLDGHHNAVVKSDETAFQKRYECRLGCNCACHVKWQFTSPYLIQSLLGELTIHWRSQKPMVRCNCSGHKGLAIIYRFPNFLLQRYFSMVLQTTLLDGPELLLRVPRVLPWTHLLWRYSVCGDLMAIKRMYADRIASPFDVDPAGRNVLLYASKQQNVEVTEFLLNQKADPDQADSLGRVPSERLLKRSFGGMYGEQGSIVMRRILNSREDEFEFGTLHRIVLGLEFKALQSVLDATTDTIDRPDSMGRTALFWAVIRDNVEHVGLLLDYGADVNAKDNHGFAPIDVVRGPVVCKQLLDAGAINNVNSQNYHHSSLHEQVIENGNADVVSSMAAAGWDIDIKDHDHETPLLNAIYAGHTEVVNRLVELGANVNNANLSSRDSALHFAAAFDRPVILKLLFEKGADPGALDCNGRNVAHCAAMKGSTELIKIMTAAKLTDLDLWSTDYEGKTPGDYMSERIVLTDMEVGVHEAWEELVAALTSPPPAYDSPVSDEISERVIELVDAIEEDLEKVVWPKVPGAFPIDTVRKAGVCAA